MEKSVFGQKWGKNCQRCGKELKRVAKYCIQCRKIVDDELGEKYRKQKK